MAINGTIGASGAGAANETSDTSARKAKTTMDKEAFLKLLVAQIANQDPLAPLEGTEFVAQLSQFSAVEQAISQTERLDMLSAQIGGLANSEAAAMVGKKVTVTDPTTEKPVTGSVTKVSFEKGYAELFLDNGKTAPVSNLVSVGG